MSDRETMTIFANPTREEVFAWANTALRNMPDGGIDVGVLNALVNDFASALPKLAAPAPVPADVEGLAERLEAEHDRQASVHSLILLERDRSREDAFTALNQLHHAMGGRDPVGPEAAAALRSQAARIAELEEAKKVFPTHGGDGKDDPRKRVLGGGMTLRDWFAGQALSGIISTAAAPMMSSEYGIRALIAKHAYEIADAMLAAQEKPHD